MTSMTAKKPEPAAAYEAVQTSKFEPWLVKTVCEPVLSITPRAITPNQITVFNHFVAWAVFAGAAYSPRLVGGEKLALLSLVALGSLATMILDCLDGMQARRTGRTSKLGEFLDHWLDAIMVPLTGVGMGIMLEIPPLFLIPAHLAGAMVYNAQLVHYQAHGKFVHPPTSGAEAQFGVAIGYVLAGLAWYAFPRPSPIVEYTGVAFSLVALFVQLKQCKFYYDQLTGKLDGHFAFIAPALVFAGLFAAGVIDVLTYALAITFLSFRSSGSYVLRILTQRTFDGRDPVVTALAGLALLVYFAAPHTVAGWPVVTVIVGVACLYMVAANFVDFARAYPALRPKPRA
jgi:phosphatidylglycerophosphate synthase